MPCFRYTGYDSDRISVLINVIQSVESENGNMIIYVEEHKLKFLQEFLQWEGLDVFTKKHPSPERILITTGHDMDIIMNIITGIASSDQDRSF